MHRLYVVIEFQAPVITHTHTHTYTCMNTIINKSYDEFFQIIGLIIHSVSQCVHYIPAAGSLMSSL